MASKKSKTPAVRYLRYELTNSGTPGTETSHYIDLAKDLSAVNRRLMRQGRRYHVKKVTIVSSNTLNQGNRVSVSTIPESWVSQMAWKRGFEVFKEMNKRAMVNVAGSSIAGTWADFKVYMSNGHRTGTVLEPKDNGGNNVSPGEWVYSQYITPDGTTTSDAFTAMMLGDHQGAAGSRSSVGLIKSYGESRATVQVGSPDVPGDLSDDPLINVFDYGTEIDEVLERLELDNDVPPYDQANYPGDDGNMPKPLVVQDTTLVDGRTTVGGFHAMCGLIELETKSAEPSDVYSVLVELAPGSYRGIAAEMI
ncbi:MAG: putative capsid protein [Cressdnaviricota sp.]|nr:MAG: putative capsid protein [Cressdnaviricota sp.]